MNVYRSTKGGRSWYWLPGVRWRPSCRCFVRRSNRKRYCASPCSVRHGRNLSYGCVDQRERCDDLDAGAPPPTSEPAAQDTPCWYRQRCACACRRCRRTGRACRSRQRPLRCWSVTPSGESSTPRAPASSFRKLPKLARNRRSQFSPGQTRTTIRLVSILRTD
jgi:hypothetical protein